MEKNVIFGFGIGALLGSVVTYFVCKQRFENDLEYESEIIKQDYEDRLASGIDRQVAEKIAKKYTGDEKNEEEMASEEEISIKNRLKSNKKTPVEVEKVDYNGVSTGKTKKLDCEMIDLKRYAEDELDFEKLSYSYFNVDKVFADIDDNENIDLNAPNHIDMDLVEDLASVEDTIYIRNHSERKDFEIIVHSCSYAEFMLTEGE